MYVNEADFALWFAKLVCIAEENTEDIIVNEEWESFSLWYLSFTDIKIRVRVLSKDIRCISR